MTKFEKYSGAGFSESEVEYYLEALANKGWSVFADERPLSYVIITSDEGRIEISYTNKKEWRVKAYEHGVGKYVRSATSFYSFTTLVVAAATALGHEIDAGPTSIRLAEETPVSNRVGLANLAHGSAVTSIFDPYFDDMSISVLHTLNNLGLNLVATVDVLTTTKTSSRLTDLMISAFAIETGHNLNIRLCKSEKEHRRFLLLSSGDSIVIGCSLNSIDKNEAARIETSSEDQSFFDSQWQSSSSR